MSCCALINLQAKHAFALEVRQTQPKNQQADRLEQYHAQLQDVLTRFAAFFERRLKAVVADGQYAKTLFFDRVTQHGLVFVTKLQRNADLRYRYQGEHPKRRGPRQKYAGKVDFQDWQRWTAVSDQPHERVVTAVVYAPHFKRQLRVVVVQRLDKRGKVKAYALLCCTDVNIGAQEIRELYSARFEIEFLFRDAKQFAALNTCQLRSTPALEAHWNAALAVVGLMRAQVLQQAEQPGEFVFRLEDLKRRAYNALYARRILLDLGLEARFQELAALPSSPLHFGLKAA